MKKCKNGQMRKINGWTYLSIKGSPKERGYAHGYLIADRFKQIQEMLNFHVYNDYGQTWDFFIESGATYLKDNIIKHFHEHANSGRIFGSGTKFIKHLFISYNMYCQSFISMQIRQSIGLLVK